ncbi:hypothetical protein LIER_44090 [Lithospermum erythrorhizon]|uniref:Uncharacterized protein n=1 Tax=Lithospermum erythrorhizon TaxID=34254 RepID=A0AAV3PDD3_LITER
MRLSNAETPHFESKEERSFSLAKEVTTRARAPCAPGGCFLSGREIKGKTHAMIMISSFAAAAAKQFNLSIRVNRNYDLFSRWEQEGWTPPSMKRPSLPARVVDAKKSMNFPSLLKSTGWESELELKEFLMRKPLPRGKGLKSIQFCLDWSQCLLSPY